MIADHRNAPVNALGYLRVMFAVDDLNQTLARLREHGAQFVDGVVQSTTYVDLSGGAVRQQTHLADQLVAAPMRMEQRTGRRRRGKLNYGPILRPGVQQTPQPTLRSSRKRRDHRHAIAVKQWNGC